MEFTTDFIRKQLEFDQGVTSSMRNHSSEVEHYRFIMSGYGKNVTSHNQMVLNKFDKFGIYDYTDFLFVDFYKGTPTIYLRYISDDKLTQLELPGYGTTEIIKAVLELTVLSGKIRRRRI